ncbi:MAG: STAS domain-containing protein [Acidimicrobiales bacterium]
MLGTVVVSLHGEIDGSGSSYLAVVLDDLIEGQGNRAVVVDLGDLRRLDPSAVEVLAVAAHRIGRRGGRLRLSNASADLAVVLTTAGLAGLVDDDGPPRPHPLAGAQVYGPAPRAYAHAQPS